MLKYVFASPTEEESKQAEERLNHLKPYIKFKSVLLEQDLTKQGLQTESFDMIVLSLLGDGHDLDGRLMQAKRLLKPRGKLCSLSIINPGMQLSLVSHSIEVLQR